MTKKTVYIIGFVCYCIGFVLGIITGIVCFQGNYPPVQRAEKQGGLVEGSPAKTQKGD